MTQIQFLLPAICCDAATHSHLDAWLREVQLVDLQCCRRAAQVMDHNYSMHANNAEEYVFVLHNY